MKFCARFAVVGTIAVLAGCSANSSKSPEPSSTAEGEDASFTVPEGGVTWDDWGQGFFTKYCVECHGVANPDGLYFGEQSIVVTNADTIRCGVAVSQEPSWNCPSNLPAEQFPISDSAGDNPKPTDGERDEVVAWIDAGCP